jgi:hypothetical protein
MRQIGIGSLMRLVAVKDAEAMCTGELNAQSPAKCKQHRAPELSPTGRVLDALSDGKGRSRCDLINATGLTVSQLDYAVSCLVTSEKIIRDGGIDARIYYLNRH